jgi:hypothetical protein
MFEDILVIIGTIGIIIFMIVIFKKVMKPFKNDEGKYDKGELMKVVKLFFTIVGSYFIAKLLSDWLLGRI